MRLQIVFIILFVLLFSSSCTKETLSKKYITENIIIVVIDGSRYSETWGDSTHQYIPCLSNQMSQFGVVNTQFFNNGSTTTMAGHISITTGVYQEINNLGLERPKYPSYFQYFNKKFRNDKDYSWIITSKDKLEILGNCKHIMWSNKYVPSVDCGINGIGSGYRHDSLTVRNTIQVLSEYHPRLMLVNFREPDYSAHSGNWNRYIQGILSTDEYAYQIWQYLQQDIYYKGKTTMFITNDHGRHLDGIADGFMSHGDDCLGCRHINFYAYGPDFKKGVVLNVNREIIDISTTIAELLQFEIEYGHGKVMDELFE